MALRILSGLIWANPNRVPQAGGFARITFNPFELAGATDGVELRNKKAIGSGSFLARPVSIVAARQFWLGSSRGTLNISDTVSAVEMRVDWAGPGGASVHEEIPFLVIGEVAEPGPPKGPRPRRVPPSSAPKRPPRRRRRR